ncbi:hypothetical protein [Methylocella silvestris]|uniref:Uncharacterized protein n=1 Tax=Methylocella silvestris TaxID=199596 RepID=A0A2J7TJP8_METSI|nr:hypothetical protein [Methylocella silvestris]PNG26994.1 hypothetical protein CR492_04640 [Methylocella silvestris]
MFWFALFSAATLAVYFSIIRPKLKQFRLTTGIIDELDDYALAGWARIKLRVLGLKTWILGVAGIGVAALPQLLDGLAHIAPGALESLHLVDFSAFFAPEVALKISGAIMLAMTVTHILGLAKAAEIEPKPKQDKEG